MCVSLSLYTRMYLCLYVAQLALDHSKTGNTGYFSSRRKTLFLNSLIFSLAYASLLYFWHICKIKKKRYKKNVKNMLFF